MTGVCRAECIDDPPPVTSPLKKLASPTSSIYSGSTGVEDMGTKAPSIAIIVCSNRRPRVCPQIADFVADTIKQSKTYQELYPRPSFSTIDLKECNLPFFDESGIPSKILDPDDYGHEHTRAWSREIQKHDAFVFVTPQYNWGIPAVLKNAIDFLYHEWTGKPAMIITYGGHGGDKCNAQLRQVLTGLKMSVTTSSVQLQYPSKEFTLKAFGGLRLGLDASAKSGPWIPEQAGIRQAYAELVVPLNAK